MTAQIGAGMLSMVLAFWGAGLSCSAEAGPIHAVRYVAMGSSYAAGPGVTTSADTPATACARSHDNYAHQVARRLGFDLVDVSCSGATTAAVLGAWRGMPAQIEAVTPDTELVTVTIGGNDLDYVGNLYAASCRATDGVYCAPKKAPTASDYAADEEAMHAIVRQIRKRAAKARIVLVEYPVVLPPSGTCAAAPMTPDDADMLRATAARLAALTERVATAEKVDLVPFDRQSAGHDACAADPWMSGYLDKSGRRAKVPYHPNLEGMTAEADAIVALLSR